MNRNDIKEIIESDLDVNDKITQILNRHHVEMNELKTTNSQESEKLNDEFENRIKELNEREQLINQKECKLAFNKDIDDFLKRSELKSDSGLKSEIESYIDFSSMENYKSSFKKITKTLEQMKFEPRAVYEPNKGDTADPTNTISKAFAPPEVY